MKKLLVLVILPLLFSGCITQILGGPNFVVLSHEKRVVGEGIASQTYIDVTVRNDGDDGIQKIKVVCHEPKASWSQEKEIYLGSGETATIPLNVEVNSGTVWTYDVSISGV